MNVQLAVVLLFLAVASFYLLQRSWRTWKPKGPGCSGGCGCAKTSSSAAKKDLVPLQQVSSAQRS